MMRLMVAAALVTASTLSLAGLAWADRQQVLDETYPVIAQLELRDRTVTITAAPQGRLYAIADETGEILSAGLTEEQLAEQYPDLADLLQPAIAEDGTGLFMLAPAID
ncbi:MAG: hypothetical protein AAFW95_14980 [Cyanobacteria bacterium J06638_6]